MLLDKKNLVICYLTIKCSLLSALSISNENLLGILCPTHLCSPGVANIVVQ